MFSIFVEYLSVAMKKSMVMRSLVKKQLGYIFQVIPCFIYTPQWRTPHGHCQHMQQTYLWCTGNTIVLKLWMLDTPQYMISKMAHIFTPVTSCVFLLGPNFTPKHMWYRMDLWREGFLVTLLCGLCIWKYFI